LIQVFNALKKGLCPWLLLLLKVNGTRPSGDRAHLMAMLHPQRRSERTLEYI